MGAYARGPAFMQQQKTSALGKPDVDLFIVQTCTQLKAGPSEYAPTSCRGDTFMDPPMATNVVFVLVVVVVVIKYSIP